MSGYGLPRKTREIQNHHIDSTAWNDVACPRQAFATLKLDEGGASRTRTVVISGELAAQLFAAVSATV